MSSIRQIEANRRNSQLSTGPNTEEGKKRSRRNAIRHGLTAETVIDVLEDAEDYAAFEMAVTADFDAQTAVERELVLRLASVLWRLRRVSAIEAGLFKQQARGLLQFRHGHSARPACEDTGDSSSDDDGFDADFGLPSQRDPESQFSTLTQAFVKLTNLPMYPLDRLSRYEAALWRQARQILFTLRCLERRKPWERFGR